MYELNLMNLLLFLASQNSTGGSDGGGTSVYISNCSIDENGDLIVTLYLMGSGTSSTRYTVYKNSLYTSYLDSVYTIFNSELKSIQDYIDGGNSFCNENESYSLYYNTTDFGWG